MDPEQIVAQAQATIAARRQQAAAAAQQIDDARWQGPLRWLLPLGVLLVLSTVVLVPGSMPHKLLQLMGGMCSLRPGHSYFSGALQQPLESRMVGIYAGFAVSLIVLLWRGRLGAPRVGSWPMLGVLALLFSSMVLDGINSTLAEVRAGALYAPANVLRLTTGLAFGTSVAPVMVWLLGDMVPRDRHGRAAAVMTLRTLLIIGVGQALVAAVVMSGAASSYIPVAVLSIGGVVAVPASLALVIIVRSARLRRQVTHPRQLIAPTALAELLGSVVILGSALLRWHG
ncbi:MAG TPA: DUF2085 domain-containing protein [Herpetosiphonaceae bacterium]